MADDDRSALEQIHQHMRTCLLCLDQGYEIYPRAIFSGSSSARIMAIGQAPGITEKEAGRPFNAGSGTRLFQWLSQAGIEEQWFRRTQYMTSITKCYPGRSNAGSGDRVPSRVEQELCSRYLQAEIRLVAPELIIPIGRLAIERFFSKKARLTEIIGTEKRTQSSWVVPLPHPSGASRWPQVPANQQLIDRAVERIGVHYRALFS